MTARITPVVQDVAALGFGHAYRLLRAGRFGCCQGRHAVPRVRRGVEQEVPPARAEHGRGRSGDDRFELRSDGGVVALGVLMDPGNGAARQDVMELLQQDQPPEAF